MPGPLLVWSDACRAQDLRERRRRRPFCARFPAIVVCPAGSEEIVGISRYEVNPATRLADIAFTERDDWQARGVGTLLMRRITEIGRERGLAGFTADVLQTNKPMLAIFQKSGLRFETKLERGVYHMAARFDEISA